MGDTIICGEVNLAACPEETGGITFVNETCARVSDQAFADEQTD